MDVIKGSENHDDIKVDNSSFFKAIWTILLADFTMSLDNVLGVAGAAGDHYGLLVFGLGLILWLIIKSRNGGPYESDKQRGEKSTAMAMAPIKEFSELYPDWHMRVYRTPAGLGRHPGSELRRVDR